MTLNFLENFINIYKALQRGIHTYINRHTHAHNEQTKKNMKHDHVLCVFIHMCIRMYAYD